MTTSNRSSGFVLRIGIVTHHVRAAKTKELAVSFRKARLLCDRNVLLDGAGKLLELVEVESCKVFGSHAAPQVARTPLPRDHAVPEVAKHLQGS